MTRSSLALLASLALAAVPLAAGSTSPGAPAPEAAAPPTPAQGSDDARLALAPSHGSSPADAAVDAAQAAVRQNPQKDDAWIVLGRTWIRKARESNDPGFYLNAAACASVVLGRDPESALALDLRGLVLLNEHAFAEARELAARVTAKHPDDPVAWGTTSDALLELGLYDEATEAAQRMIDLKPNLPSYSRASHLQWLRGDVASAKQTVRAALDAGRDVRRDPEPGAWVLVQAATIFWHEGDHEGADAGFDKALERVPGYAPALVGKGRVALARGDAARAAELLDRAYRASPLPETAWLLGDARAASGDAVGAAQAYARVEKDGRRTDPRTLSLFLSTKARDPELALALAREEYAKRQDIVTEDALAWALYRAGRLDEAKASIVRARRLGTPDARLAYHEGAIRIALGERAKGRALVAHALKTNPAFDPTGAREAAALVSDALANR